MNLVSDRLKKHIKTTKRSHAITGTMAFVMSRTTKIMLGEYFYDVPRLCVNPEGFLWYGCRLFFDPTLPTSVNYFFDLDTIKKRMPELYEKENCNEYKK